MQALGSTDQGYLMCVPNPLGCGKLKFAYSASAYAIEELILERERFCANMISSVICSCVSDLILRH